ncbi:MAG TPA: DUF4383 domain-containing protein [Gemmatimonadaceae bacterium]|nr:DUF4383 domain-containing protein [Gemmatimonadaceae bacterium]
MTTVQRTALLFGVIFLLIGIAGFFVTGGMTMNADMATAPRLFGLFPVNLLHNLVHLAFGVWGLAAASRFSAARLYAQAGGIIYLVLALLGFVAPNLFGLVPLGGNDIWLHVLLGIVLAAVGFTARAPAATTTGTYA